MKIPHKHAEFIKAWAEGETVYYQSVETVEWKPIFKGWSWDNQLVSEYRINPPAISRLAVLQDKQTNVIKLHPAGAFYFREDFFCLGFIEVTK